MSLEMVRFNADKHGALVAPLTQILHAAYGALAARGMRYYASHQEPEVTLDRLQEGEGYLAFYDGELVGTVTLYPKRKSSSDCEYYKREGVFSFGQFAISPLHQGRGFGARLMEFVESRAREYGADELALDTSERADDLIAMYNRRGYEHVGSVQWDRVNYRSVVMSKRLKTVQR